MRNTGKKESQNTSLVTTSNKQKYWTIEKGKVVEVKNFKVSAIEFVKGVKTYQIKDNAFEFPAIKALHQRSATMKFIRMYGYNLNLF